MKAISSRMRGKSYLIVASTERELLPLRQKIGNNPQISLHCCGVGLTEAAYNLARYLAEQNENLPSVIINFGIGGAYPESGLDVLDLCLATGEVIADLGVCDSGSVNFLTDKSLNIIQNYSLDNYAILDRAVNIFKEENIPFHQGMFVSLNCASATTARGKYFKNKHQAICENMEGAALARVCLGFDIEFLELRTISNLVEDRDSGRKWLIEEACEIGGTYVSNLVLKLLGE